MPNAENTIEEELKLHAPFLNKGVVTFFEEMDMLGFVHSQQDPKSKIVDRVIVEDKLMALGGAYKQVRKLKGLRDSIEILEQVEGEVDEAVAANVGRLLMRKSPDEVHEPVQVDDALDWVVGILADKKNLKAYHKLFDKSLASDPKLSEVEVPKVKRNPKPKKPALVQIPEAPKKPAVSKSGIRYDAPTNVGIQAVPDINETREQRRLEIIESRKLAGFASGLTSYIVGRIAGGEVRYSEVTEQVAAILEIEITHAELAVDRVVANSDNLLVNRLKGSRKIGSTNKLMNELIPDSKVSGDKNKPATSQQEVLLDIDDIDTVKNILTIIANKQHLTQGATSREIELALKAQGDVVEPKKLKILIRTICEISDQTVFEQRGNYGRGRKGAQLFFKSSEGKKAFITDPNEFVDQIYEKVLKSLETSR